jgi:enterochelin esterase family protein
VLVLLHGGFDTEATWTEYGRAHFILDNLLAVRKATPMIVVMVNGFAERKIAGDNQFDRTSGPTAFEDDLLKDVIPFVEKRYRVIASKDSRAIAGRVVENETM